MKSSPKHLLNRLGVVWLAALVFASAAQAQVTLDTSRLVQEATRLQGQSTSHSTPIKPNQAASAQRIDATPGRLGVDSIKRIEPIRAISAPGPILGFEAIDPPGESPLDGLDEAEEDHAELDAPQSPQKVNPVVVIIRR